MRTRALAVVAVSAALLLAACSSSSEETTSSAAAPSAAASEMASAVASAGMGTPEMAALCKQMVDEKLSPEDATALAEENGFVARVGTIDGAPQAVTMDLRDDRFTFDVEGGVVTSCTYG